MIFNTEMDQLETHPDFNPAIKITGIDEEKRQGTSPQGDQAAAPPHGSGDSADRSDLGLAMFNEEDSATEKEQKPKPQGNVVTHKI